MGGQFRENWKRLTNQILPKTSPNALEDKDIVRVEDLAGLVGASGIYRVTNLTTAGPTVAIGGDEAIFDLVVIRVSGDYDVILPEEPLVGKRYEIKDGAGDGFSSNKRIVPTGLDLIEGIFTEFPLFNNYQSWSFIYAGENIWRLV